MDHAYVSVPLLCEGGERFAKIFNGFSAGLSPSPRFGLFCSGVGGTGAVIAAFELAIDGKTMRNGQISKNLFKRLCAPRAGDFNPAGPRLSLVRPPNKLKDLVPNYELAEKSRDNVRDNNQRNSGLRS